MIAMEIEKHVKVGDKIKIHFTGKLENGEVFESSFGKEPLEFKVGSGSVIQGIDEAVVGMKLDQEKMIHISSDKAYGAIEKELIISINKKDLPSKLDVKLNQQLIIPLDDGHPVKVRISKIDGDYIEFDGNHPLAGKNLIFDLKLVGID
jgi:FKBP-type peptidyl-prolyl cis-trans isomerase 2